MSDNIRVGLIGYGYASKTFHAPLIAGTPGLELAVISSSDETKVKADWPTVTVVSEPKHLFNDPNIDLIVIPTPNDTHLPLAKAALEAGKHVVVDKPFTVTLSQARELDALAKSLGRVLSVFHNRRWDSDFLTLKGLLAEGVLGEVAYFESHFDRFRPQDGSRRHSSMCRLPSATSSDPGNQTGCPPPADPSRQALDSSHTFRSQFRLPQQCTVSALHRNHRFADAPGVRRYTSADVFHPGASLRSRRNSRLCRMPRPAPERPEDIPSEGDPCSRHVPSAWVPTSAHRDNTDKTYDTVRYNKRIRWDHSSSLYV